MHYGQYVGSNQGSTKKGLTPILKEIHPARLELELVVSWLERLYLGPPQRPHHTLVREETELPHSTQVLRDRGEWQWHSKREREQRKGEQARKGPQLSPQSRNLCMKDKDQS